MLDLALFRETIARVKAQVSNNYSLKDIPQWIVENTYIKNENYSFKDHEFQLKIISDTSVEVNVMKCSQIGLSEVMARWTIAVAYNFPSFSAIVTFPFSGDANDFARTRIDPFIESSPLLKAGVNSKLNNSEIKQILQSMVYFRGTNGKTQAISIPADMIVSDEIDRSDPDTLGQYTSRLTHSPYKWRRNFSTPTVKGHGVELLMQTSRRFRNMCKCNHCNHPFVPDFFEHVKIPGFDNELRTLNKNTLSKTRFMEAQLLCPKCFKVPNLWPEHREYVQENINDHHEAAGYYVSPFDAPAIITPVSLLRAMVSYGRISEFVNQNLGQTCEDASEALVLSDITGATVITDLKSSQIHAMGCDMGLICYIAIGRLTFEGKFLIVHREKVPLGLFEKRRLELAREFRVAITVCDSQPYVDLILRMQQYDQNLYGGLFIHSRTLEVFKIKMFEGDPEEGKLPIHQAQINRNPALDELLGLFKAKAEGRGDLVVIQAQDIDLDEEYQKHLLDMKRVQIFNDDNELSYSWIKSPSAIDHWHFTTLYLYTACRLRGIISGFTAVSSPMMFMSKFKVKSEQVSYSGIPQRR